MTQPDVTARQVELLRIVRDSGGTLHTFAIDVRFTGHFGAGTTTVLDQLRQLARMGLVVSDPAPPRNGRWVVTAEADALLERADRQAVGDRPAGRG